MTLTFQPSEISEKAYQALERNHGAVEQGKVTFPEGTEVSSTPINGWRANESSITIWMLPDGTKLRYSSDWEDQVLIVAK